MFVKIILLSACLFDEYIDFECKLSWHKFPERVSEQGAGQKGLN